MFKPPFRSSLFLGAPLGFLAAVVMIQQTHAQAIPTFVNYQGRLTTPVGAPVRDNSYNVKFTLFDVAAGGTARWTGEYNVVARNGYFSVMLGSGATPFGTNLFTRPLWLETNIEGRILGPRQPLGSVPFSMTSLGVPNGAITTAMIANLAVNESKIADGAVTEKKLAPGLVVPIGGIIPYFGDSGSVPAGWQFCNGDAISAAGSPLNGKSTPDLRDRFIRGTSGDVRNGAPGGGQDQWTLNAEQMPRHSHGVNDPGHSHGVNDPGHGHFGRHNRNENGAVSLVTQQNQGVADINSSTTTAGATTGISIQGSGTGVSLQETGGGQAFPTLPRYVGLIYIMRVK